MEKGMLIQAHMNLSSPTAAQNRINQDGVKQHKSKKRGSLERSNRRKISHQCGNTHSSIIVISVKTWLMRVNKVE